ncbi:MAG: hypothetical protein HY273_05910 [Gammaproteobacteria bacterium]|nr:hypothetical protein [Gammaproteobacteria bacterium]
MRDVDVPQLRIIAPLNQGSPIDHIQLSLEARTLQPIIEYQRASGGYRKGKFIIRATR